MKRLLIALICIPASISAREIRSPLFRDDPGYRLMPLPLSDCKPWDIRGWAEAFSRRSDEAFCKKNSGISANCCASHCPLALLIFGQPAFTGAQAFSPESVAASKTVFNGDGTNRTLTCNPLLETSVLKPCLKFIDRGVMFAVQIVRRINNCWSVGTRGSVPYRDFEITYQCHNDGPAFGGETIKDQFQIQQETVDGVTVESYAYRLDALSKLPIGCTYPQNLFPVVDYRNDLHLNNAITMSNENVTDNPALPINARNPVTVIHRSDGSKPQGHFALPLPEAQTLPALPGNGQTADDRARFVDGTDYQPLGSDPITQAQLWVVPSVDDEGLVPAAQVIKDNIDELLQIVPLSTEQFFQEWCGNCLAPQSSKGIGDTQTEYFFRYQPQDTFYFEGLFGIRFPTGKRIKDPKNILLWPTGNNGHYEYRVGAHVGIQLCDYVMVNANSYYTRVATHEEQVIASYQGARVKNIGSPQLPADIDWHYYLGNFDALFMQPCTRGIFGIDLGYELYDKSHDRVRFKQCSTIDCLCTDAQLDSCVLQERTHVVSHKIRLTAFYDTSIYHQHEDKKIQWSIFGGYSAIVGGINIPKEHGPHGGIMIIY